MTWSCGFPSNFNSFISHDIKKNNPDVQAKLRQKKIQNIKNMLITLFRTCILIFFIETSNSIFNSKWNLMLLYSPYSLHHSIFKWNEWNVSPRLFLISSLLVLLMYYLFFIWKSPQLEPQYGLIVVYIAYDQNKTENSILKKI